MVPGSFPSTPSERRARRWGGERIRRRELVLTIVVTAAIWIIGSHLVPLRPLVWLETFVHESAHAAVATVLGLHVSSVTINPHGGGLTTWSGQPSTFKIVAVGSAGYLGAAVVGGALIELCRRLRGARVATGGLAAVITLIGIAWVPWSTHPAGPVAEVTRSSSGDGRFTIAFCIITVIGLIALTVQRAARPRRMVVLVIATTLCLASIESLKVVSNISSHGGDSDASIVAAVTPLSSWMWSTLWLLVGGAVCAASAWSVVARGHPVDEQ